MTIQVSGSTGVSTNALPFLVGQVNFFATSSAPAGFLKCSGQAVSRTTYAKLFAEIGTTYGAGDGSTTFNLPDLRGEFIRGLDDGRGVDTGRVIGSAQASDNKSHTHITDSQGAHTHTVPQIGTTTGSSNDGPRTTGSGVASTSSAGAHTHTAQASGGTESRPRNVALLTCIFTGVQ